MFPEETDSYTPLVKQILRIDEIIWGDEKRGFIVRYRGQLVNHDSAAAYDQLAASLRPLKAIPLFRKDAGQHVVILIPGTIQPGKSKAWVNGVLFLFTIITVLMAGTLYATSDPFPENLRELLLSLLNNLGKGIPFALTLLAILAAHEFGHYLAGRYHKTAVTLPYFIPFPLSLFGTMGAFIQLKEPPKNRRILLDISLAGPLAGLVVAIPLLFLGLYLSPVETLHAGGGVEGNSILYLAIKYLVKGELLPQPISYQGIDPLAYWLRYYLTSTPLPIGGRDIVLNPIAWAAWAGLLVTALNLIPAGQLDGGHLAYVLFGRKAALLLPFIMGTLLLLGLVWNGWWVWIILLLFLGRYYAEPLDQITPLDPRRKALAMLGLVIFVLVFVPVPLLSL